MPPASVGICNRRRDKGGGKAYGIWVSRHEYQVNEDGTQESFGNMLCGSGYLHGVESEESGVVGGWTGNLSLAWLLGKASNETGKKKKSPGI